MSSLLAASRQGKDAIARRSPYLRYGCAVALAGVSVLSSYALNRFFHQNIIYILLYPTILIAAGYGGFWPGMLCLALCVAGAPYLYREGPNAFFHHPAPLFGMFFFVVASIMMILFADSQRDAKIQAEVNAQQARDNAEAFHRSEREFRALVENLPDVIVRLDRNLRHVYVSPVVERFTGQPPAFYIGKTYAELGLPPELYAPWVKVLQAALATGAPQTFEGRYVAVDGKRNFTASIAPEFGADGAEENLLVVIRDTTEQKRAEADLRASETMYRTLGEAVPDLVWACNPQGELEYANRRCVEYMDFDPERISELDWREVVSPDDIEPIRARWAEATARLEAVDFETRYRSKDGCYRWFMSRAMPILDAHGKIEKWVGTSIDIDDRKRMEEALRQSELRARALAEADIIGVFFWDKDGGLLEANNAFLNMVGYTREDFLAGRVLWPVLTPPEFQSSDSRALKQLAATGKCAPYEKDLIRKDGARVPTLLGAAVTQHEPLSGVAFLLDLSERKRLEEQLRQAQKIEAIGRLAGGVAHDFNNLLTAIVGYTELAEEELTSDNPAYSHLQDVLKVTDRATDLTRQLLAFARRQLIAPIAVNLNDLVMDIEPILRRLIGEHIFLTVNLTGAPCNVKVDPGQFQQVLVNLAVNARDAMPDGGSLRIETANVTLDEDLPHTQLLSGQYVLLTVRDTGMGISEEAREHLFEPFFTTKERGKGTGLGLATCYGIVRQSAGHIRVHSEPGAGTVFEVFLPCTEEVAAIVVARQAQKDLPHGTETIVLAEDEEMVRSATATTLRSLGYETLAASNGMEALRMARESNHRIDLLLTDVVMPQMSGPELASHFARIFPQTRVLFMSGYTENLADRSVLLEAEGIFLQKPFTSSILAHKVREVLDSPDYAPARIYAQELADPTRLHPGAA